MLQDRIIKEVETLSNAELAQLLGITLMGAIKKRKNQSYTVVDADKILAKYKIMILNR